MEYTTEQIRSILAASLSGEKLSEQEAEQLESWKNTPANRQEYEYYKRLFGRRKELLIWEQAAHHRTFSAKAFRPRPHRWSLFITGMKYAAVLLPFAGILFWLLWQTPKTSEIVSTPTLVRNDIAPGKQKARLLLENGESVSLSDSSMSIQSHQDIQVGKGGVLQYAVNHSQQPKKAVYHTLVVDRGAEFQLVLPDGSKVWLNSASELRYPDVFNDSTRKVYLKGEAYFDVQHKEAQPFIVSGKDYAIRVLGTAFNVSCYDDEPRIVTTLVQGKVAYQAGEHNGELKPGWQCVYDTEAQATDVKKVNVNDYISWKNGLFVFDNIRMEELAKQLERWYNVEVEFADEAVRNNNFSGAMERYKPVSYLITLLNETNTVNCTLEGKTLIFRQK